MALAEVRAEIATALADIGVPVHAYPPGTVQPPAAVLIPGSPYLDPNTTWGQVGVSLEVRLLVSSSAGAAAMERLDALIDSAVAALLATSVTVGQVGPPTVAPDSAALVVDIPLTAVWKDD